jgi:hypothetical protein
MQDAFNSFALDNLTIHGKVFMNGPTPEQALNELANIVVQAPLPKAQHLFLDSCVAVLAAAISKNVPAAEIKE